MNKEVITKLNMLVRVGRFCSEYVGEFPAESLGRELCDLVATEVISINEATTLRDSGTIAARLAGIDKTAARAKLLVEMGQIRNAAVALDRGVNRIAARFLLPKNLGDQRLLSTARQFKIEASPMVADFVRAGQTPDFLDRLTTWTDDFAVQVDAKNTGVGDQIRGNSALYALAREGASVVQQLDRLMMNHFATRPSELAEWHLTKRMRQDAVKSVQPTQSQPQLVAQG